MFRGYRTTGRSLGVSTISALSANLSSKIGWPSAHAGKSLGRQPTPQAVMKPRQGHKVSRGKSHVSDFVAGEVFAPIYLAMLK
jgi:hypothetical protein